MGRVSDWERVGEWGSEGERVSGRVSGEGG